MSKIFNKNSKFELLQLDSDKELNYILNLEKKITNVLKDLKSKEEVDYNHLHLSDSCLGISYHLTKVHK